MPRSGCLISYRNAHVVIALRDADVSSRYPLLQSLALRNVNTIRWEEAKWLVMKFLSITRIVLACGRGNTTTLLDRLCPLKRVDGLDEDEDRSGSISWPLLPVGFSSIGSTELGVLYDMISDRISRGTPLISVQLGWMDIPADRLEWLQARVRVEMVAGLGYCD